MFSILAVTESFRDKPIFILSLNLFELIVEMDNNALRLQPNKENSADNKPEWPFFQEIENTEIYTRSENPEPIPLLVSEIFRLTSVKDKANNRHLFYPRNMPHIRLREFRVIGTIHNVGYAMDEKKLLNRTKKKVRLASDATPNSKPESVGCEDDDSTMYKHVREIEVCDGTGQISVLYPVSTVEKYLCQVGNHVSIVGTLVLRYYEDGPEDMQRSSLYLRLRTLEFITEKEFNNRFITLFKGFFKQKYTLD